MIGGLTARPNEIKPDPVDQPERTAHYDCAMCIAEMLHNTIAQRQFCYIPLPPDQHHSSDEAKWGGS